VGNGDNLEEGFLADGATGSVFVLFWEAMAEPEVEAFSLLPGVRLKGLFLCLPCTMVFTVSFPVAVINGYC